MAEERNFHALLLGNPGHGSIRRFTFSPSGTSARSALGRVPEAWSIEWAIGPGAAVMRFAGCAAARWGQSQMQEHGPLSVALIGLQPPATGGRDGVFSARPRASPRCEPNNATGKRWETPDAAVGLRDGWLRCGVQCTKSKRQSTEANALVGRRRPTERKINYGRQVPSR